MALAGKKVLNVREIASILFSKKRPQPHEIRAVEVQFAAGRLRGKCTGDGSSQRWTTTPQQLAEFMANEAYHRQLKASGIEHEHGFPADRLSRSYSTLLTDYFQAVVFRRRAKVRDKRFQRAVVAGQVVFIGAILFGVVLSIQSILPAAIAPERAAIENWMAENHTRYEILNMHRLESAADDSDAAFRVQYRYFRSGGKGIETDRVFRLANQQVVTVDSFE